MKIDLVLTGSALAVFWYVLLWHLTTWSPVSNGLYYVSEKPTATSITSVEGKAVFLGPRCHRRIKTAKFGLRQIGDSKYNFWLDFSDSQKPPESDRMALCLDGRCLELWTAIGINNTGSFVYADVSDRWFMTEMSAYLGITPWFWYPIQSFFRDYTSTTEIWIYATAFVMLVCWIGFKIGARANLIRMRSLPYESVSGKW